ncbi:MAG: 50S ribosomal protein L17 [candidate division WOR-3 bacterium]|nr:50S ribosomal protein L17 [candidate division WOR-3 bacterium]
MRHGDRVKKLGRKYEHRRALMRNLIAALIRYERIRTTVAKAKEARRHAERLVRFAISGTLADRRQVARMVSEPALVRKLFNEIAPRLADRQGGYTRIHRLGYRPGDSAEMAYLEFVVRSEKPAAEEKEKKQPKKQRETKAKGVSKKPAKKQGSA